MAKKNAVVEVVDAIADEVVEEVLVADAAGVAIPPKAETEDKIEPNLEVAMAEAVITVSQDDLEDLSIVLKEAPAPLITKRVAQVIYLEVGPVAIADLRCPFGFSKEWNEDMVKTFRVAANTKISVALPEGCDVKKWVNYYRQMATLGLRIVRVSTEEV